MREFCAFIILVLLLPAIAKGERPQLVNSDVWISENRIIATDFQTISGTLEFDQPLYLAESALCPRAEEDCAPLDCTPCDWSGQNPEGCNNLECCGPAGDPDYVDSRNDWCSSPGQPDYTTVEIGESTETATLRTGDIAYYRFFLSEDTLCYPVSVKARMDYGSVNVFLSRVNPFPSREENAQFTRITSDYGLGQGDWILCPNLHEDFGPGTWAIGIEAVLDSSYHIDVLLGPDQHPISSSPDAIPCSEVPESALLRSEGDVSLCLEEGKTTAVDFPPGFESFYAQLLLPIPQGCHTINLVVAPQREKGSKESDMADPDLYCLPTEYGGATPTFENAILAAWKRNNDRVVISGCFEEEVTYVYCSAQLWVVGQSEFLFSIVSRPHRFPILGTQPGSLTYDQGRGAVSAFIDGEPHRPCGDYYTACFEWTSYPSTDPLIFWPQHGDVETVNNFFDPIPSTEYFDLGLAKPVENAISFSIGLQLGNERVFTLEDLLERGTLTLTYVTNEAGEPVQFPEPGKLQPDSFGSYIPCTALSSLKIKNDVSEECQYNSYSVLSNFINSKVNDLLNVLSLENLTALQFTMDIFNAGLVRLSCIQAAEQVLEQETQLVTRTRQTTCEYEFGTPAFEEDPCCNDNLEAVTCCLPFDLEVEAPVYTSGNSELTQTCGSPDCALTFFNDLASAANTVNDPVLGCNSGITDLQSELDYRIETEFNTVLRYCRDEVGLGEGFVGMSCRTDDDCSNWLGTCGSRGYCDLPSLSTIEDQYLNCYINEMSSALEDYLRREVLVEEVGDVPKTSPVFFDALRLAASEGACVSPSSPLDLSKRTRREWVSQEGASCKAEVLNVSSSNEDLIWRECPTLNCLGSESCWGNLADPCYANCNTEWVDFEGETEEECGSDICNVDASACEGDNVCAYCAPDGSLPCQVVEGISSEEECEDLVACQLFDGEIIFVTEGECNAQQGVCTVDCPGESCQSLRPTNGGCFVPSLVDSDSCDAYSATNGVASSWVVTDVDSVCALDISSESDCSMYPSTSWTTCGDLAFDECDGTTANQVYLRCYQSPWQPCTNQEDCENAGACSDRGAITTLINENPVQVELGSCFSSGTSLSAIALKELPFFCHQRMEEPIIGCKEIEFPTEGSCQEFSVINEEWYWRRWLTPAMSKEECVNKELGRYGCLFPGEYQHLSWHNDTYCRCMGGFPTYAWEWETGKWVGGQSRPLSWMSARSSSQYEYKSNALSFSLLESWLEAAIEDYFLFDLKSQILCENNVITVPLQTVVCDCLADDSPKDPSCYETSSGQRATPVGLSAACRGETSVVKGPSAFADFVDTSINERCTEVDLLFIEQTWFSEPPSSSQVSFQFERNEPRKGFVKNDDGVTVGQLVGDGCQLEFSHHNRVDEFTICLLITSSEDDTYPVHDFGWSDSSLSIITPLDISSDITERRITDSSTFWCANLSLEDIPTEQPGTYRLFPIIEMEDYEDQSEDYVDDTTTVLCYILGAFYVVDFLLLTLFFVILVRDIKESGKSVPMVAWLGVIFIIVCIFRIVYLFAYPNGVFEDEELAEFVVFEIPTFLLFTAVFMCIFLWRSLAQKKNFFGFAKGSKANRVVIGTCLFAVWMLFVIVTVVYSEVILEEGEDESDCPGRVASTNSLEEDSRTLSIVYQSIIIAVTFLLAVVFFHSSYVLFNQSKKGVSEAKHFIFRLGAIIVTAFFLRCIFFIILLAAEFTSSIYMFIVLMITEVFMIFLIHLQFNLRYYRSFFSGTSNLLPSGMNATPGPSTIQSRPSSRTGGTEMDD